jgi:hypothetical protein
MVARELKNVLDGKELGGWFREIVFAIDGGLEPYGTFHQRARESSDSWRGRLVGHILGLQGPFRHEQNLLI